MNARNLITLESGHSIVEFVMNEREALILGAVAALLVEGQPNLLTAVTDGLKTEGNGISIEEVRMTLNSFAGLVSDVTTP